MKRRLNKIVSLVVSITFIFQQASFAQGLAELNLASHFAGAKVFSADKFRPVHLRSLGYNPQTNNFSLLLDRGDLKKADSRQIETSARELLKYFLIGVTLPNDSFWVNLRPDSPDNVIDDWLVQTDIGRVLLEADVQLKKDTAMATSPRTPEGRIYWEKLYKKAAELLGSENVNIPTLVRPWIVPGDIIIRENSSNAYIYKATLKVMLEEDYLKGSGAYEFKDPRMKALNEYSSSLLREHVLPILNRQVNSSKKYAALRQVYYSLILAQWFKSKYYGQGGIYSYMIDRKNLAELTSQDNWSKNAYFKEYQASFKNGEYNSQEPVKTAAGQSMRSYFSGGIKLSGSSPVAGSNVIKGANPIVSIAGRISSPLSEIEVSGGTLERPGLLQVTGAKNIERIQAVVSSPLTEQQRARISDFSNNPDIMPITPAIQNYAWGGKTNIPQVLGIANTEDKPVAEAWYGMHKNGPSTADISGERVTLLDVNTVQAENPAAQHDPIFGLRDPASQYRLPFLLKLLDARVMLSIQAHPNKAKAEAGYARDEALFRAGRITKDNRTFVDNNHKPEVHVAQTDFWMLHGFRPEAEILGVFEAIPEFRGSPILGPIIDRFKAGLSAATTGSQAGEALKSFYKEIMELDQASVDSVLAPLVARLDTAGELDKETPDYWVKKAAHEASVKPVDGQYSRGIFSVYMLNLLHLRPGQGTYQEAGILHAYLEGFTVEDMANSDNVLRGGLTPKFVDIPGLLDNVTFRGGRPQILNGEKISDTETVYRTPAKEFELSRIELSRGSVYHSPAVRTNADILVVLNGQVDVTLAGGRTHTFNRGESFLVPYANSGSYTIRPRVERATLYRSSVPVDRAVSSPIALRPPAWIKQTVQDKVIKQLKNGTSGMRDFSIHFTDMEVWINVTGVLNAFDEISKSAREKFTKGMPILLAGDLRESTPQIMRAVSKAVSDHGNRIINLGLVPTPVVALMAKIMGLPCIMVTGSHIRGDMNGIKFYYIGREVLDDDVSNFITPHIQNVRERVYGQSQDESMFNNEAMFKDNAKANAESALGIADYYQKAVEIFHDRFTNLFGRSGFNIRDTRTGQVRPLRVLYLQHTTVARDIHVGILRDLGIDVDINGVKLGRLDKFKAMDTENVTPDLQKMFRDEANAYRQRHGYFPDAVVSADGDGDRPFVLDEHGNFYRGDILNLLAAKVLGVKAVVTPLSANIAVRKVLENLGIAYKRAKVGSPKVIKLGMMLADKFGFKNVYTWEVNGGGIQISDIVTDESNKILGAGKKLESLPTRDAFLPILCALKMMTVDSEGNPGGRTMSQVFQEEIESISDFKTQAGLVTFPTEDSQEIMKHFNSIATMSGRSIEELRFLADGNVELVYNADDSDNLNTWLKGSVEVLSANDSIAVRARAIREELENDYFTASLGFGRITAINLWDGIQIFFANDRVAHMRASGNAPEWRIYSQAPGQETADEIVQMALDKGGIYDRMATKVVNKSIYPSSHGEASDVDDNGDPNNDTVPGKAGSSPVQAIDFNKKNVFALVMAGGGATRYFYNKIFADPTGVGKPMLRQAFDRVTAVDPSAGPYEEFLDPQQFYVCTAGAFTGQVRSSLPQSFADDHILVDPAKRGTWPAIMWTMVKLVNENPEGVLVALTSDHVIENMDVFRETIAKAIRIAENHDAIITVGIHPAGDINAEYLSEKDRVRWEDFGALNAGDPALETGFDNVYTCNEFREKPIGDAVRALWNQNKSAGRDVWSWNSGMFIGRISSYEKALAKYRPEMFVIYSDMKQKYAAGDVSGAAEAFKRFTEKILRYNKNTNSVDPKIDPVDNSIDYALMELMTNDPNPPVKTYIIPAKFFWMDIGSLSAVFSVTSMRDRQDARGNIVVGSGIARETGHSYIWAQGDKRIEVSGLDNMVVVYGEDGTVIIVPRNLDKNVKQLTETYRAINGYPGAQGEAEQNTAQMLRKFAADGERLTFRQKSDPARKVQLSVANADEVLGGIKNGLLEIEEINFKAKGQQEVVAQISVSNNIPQGGVRVFAYGLPAMNIAVDGNVLNVRSSSSPLSQERARIMSLQEFMGLSPAERSNIAATDPAVIIRMYALLEQQDRIAPEELGSAFRGIDASAIASKAKPDSLDAAYQALSLLALANNVQAVDSLDRIGAQVAVSSPAQALDAAADKEALGIKSITASNGLMGMTIHKWKGQSKAGSIYSAEPVKIDERYIVQRIGGAVRFGPRNGRPSSWSIIGETPDHQEVYLNTSVKTNGAGRQVTLTFNKGSSDGLVVGTVVAELAAASSPAVGDRVVGGVDFRSLPVMTQNFAGLTMLKAPARQLSSAELEAIRSQITKMIDAGIKPTTERVLEYASFCCLRNDSSRDVAKVLACIADVLRLEEERAEDTDPVLRQLLAALESETEAGVGEE